MLTKIPWFKAKTYGWGWQPATWQGWLVLIVGFLLETLALWGVYRRVGLIRSLGWWMGGIVIVFTLGLMVVAWATGEKPEWRWGKKPPTPPVL